MDQPNGAALDSFQNILICDSRNHRIQQLSCEGSVEKSILTKDDGIKLPMAIKTDPAGFLIVAEYQGNIKTFRYLEVAVDLLPTHNFVQKASDTEPELVKISSSEAQATNSPAKVAHVSESKTSDAKDSKPLNDTADIKPRGSPAGRKMAWTETEMSTENSTREELDTVDCTTTSESVL